MKRLMIDPPEGWRYGFPKPVPENYLKNESLLRIWFQDQGYPTGKIDFALRFFRYWETETD
jgi:uncharacterized protein (DUF3820 family)